MPVLQSRSEFTKVYVSIRFSQTRWDRTANSGKYLIVTLGKVIGDRVPRPGAGNNNQTGDNNSSSSCYDYLPNTWYEVYPGSNGNSRPGRNTLRWGGRNQYGVFKCLGKFLSGVKNAVDTNPIVCHDDI